MQFRKTMKNKKRFRGGQTEAEIAAAAAAAANSSSPLFAGVVDAIKTHSGDAASYINSLCGAEKMECSTRFIQAANDPTTLALAGISVASYAAYLLYGTRKKQDEILQKIEKVKKERRESEESSDSNDHRDSNDHSDSNDDDSSLSDDSISLSEEELLERISVTRILISRHNKPSKKLEELQQQLKHLYRQLEITRELRIEQGLARSKHRSSDRKSKHRSSDRKSKHRGSNSRSKHRGSNRKSAGRR